jgi:hypothetical protein
MRLPICNNDLGQAGSDPGQSGELTRAGDLNIHPLAGIERAALALGAVPLSRRRTGRKGGEKLDLAGRLAWPAEQVANSLADNRQGKKEEQRAKLGGGHGRTVRR